MYTEQDLADALAAKDYKLVSEISTQLANTATEPIKKVRPKAAKSRPRTKETPAPKTDDSQSWMAPSMAGRPKKFDANGRELIEGVFSDVPGVDHAKVKFITDNQPVPGLTPTQKKAERLKKAPRDFSMQPEPVKKVEIECERCGKDYEVYPSALNKRESEHSVDLYYVCNKCDGRNKRR